MRELSPRASSAKERDRFAPITYGALPMGVTTGMFEAGEGARRRRLVDDRTRRESDPEANDLLSYELPAVASPRNSLTSELDLGREASGLSSESLLDTPEWRYVADIDPELARRAVAFVNHCLLAGGAKDKLLGPGARELIAIAALCARGEVDIAAHHIKRAYAYGVTKHQVLEAVSCVLPMTGALTVQIGARACAGDAERGA